MIGSLTFIIVAFMCSENSTPLSRASAICSARNATSASLLMRVASSTSPARSSSPSLRTVTVSPATCSMRTVVAASRVTDVSFERKSPSLIVATCVGESADQARSRCGLFFAYSFTARGARRSELPWRRTGFTALPLTRS